MGQICDAEEEANGVENVRFSRSIESRDGVEFMVESVDFCSLSVGFKSVDHHGFDEHFEAGKFLNIPESRLQIQILVVVVIFLARSL